MRLSKIESDYVLQTPTVPINNQSYIEIYSEDDGISIRPVARLEPDYPAVKTRKTETFHERYGKIELPIDELDTETMLSPSEKDGATNISASIVPGTQKEVKLNYLDWDDLGNSINSRELGDVFSNIIDNEIRTYEGELYGQALSADGGLDRETFSKWISERPNFVYETLVKNCRLRNINEFGPRGAFHNQIKELENVLNLDGGRIIEGTKQIGVVEALGNQDESINYDLKSVDGVIVPEENETLEDFLEDFSR